MTVSIPRQLLRPTGALVATILISTAAILYYVQYSITDLRQRLPLETVEHQRDLVISIQDLLALREAVIVARTTPSAASFQKISGRVRTLHANLETSHHQAEYLLPLGGMEISAAIRTLVRDLELWLREGALGYPPNSPYVLNLIDARVADTHRRVLEHFAESSDSAFDLLERETAALERFGAGIVPAVIFVSLLALILVAYVLRQRRAEAAARAAQQRLRDAIDSISGGLALFDSDERLVLCNPRYADLFPGARRRVSSVPSPGCVSRSMSRSTMACCSDVNASKSASARCASDPCTPPLSRYACNVITPSALRRSQSCKSACSKSGSILGSRPTSSRIVSTSPASNRKPT